MTDTMLRDLARVAEDVARAAGAVLRSRFAGPRRVETKSNVVDLVTDADHAAESLILELLKSAFPEHSFLSEEAGSVSASTGAVDPEDRVVWIVDPLDGTVNFAHGFPHFAVSIAAAAGGVAGNTLVGVVYDPMRDELFSAHQGAQATLDGTPIGVSSTDSLSRSLIATGFPYDRREQADFYLAHWREVMRRSRDVRRVGAAALDLAWVACGRFEAFWEWNLKPWDVAAGALLVRQSGGRVTDFDGRDLLQDVRQTLASNGCIHQEMLAALRAATDTVVAAD